jgi:hypothetical protein
VTVTNIRIVLLLLPDLGVSSPDWWHEAVETKGTYTTLAANEDCNCTSEVCSCRSPVFKTPQAGLKSKKSRKSCLKPLAMSRQRGSRGKSVTKFHGFTLSCMI